MRGAVPHFAVVVGIATLAALPIAANAVVPGENGRIVMVSGRDNGDALARVHLLPVFSNTTGDGTVQSAFTPVGGQYRHPSWSPDRTKVVVANGVADNNPATQNFDLFVYDFEANTLAPLDATQLGDSLSSDRPAWSPDGTRIAYEHQPTDNSTERNIMVKTFGSAAPATPLTTGAPIEGKPAWSSDSLTVYYTQLNGTDLDIVREPAAGGTVTPVLATDAVDEFQPALSPDGTQLCFTRQTTPGDTGTADVMVTTLPTPGIPVDLSDNPATNADYNCTWSPDGQMIAYVRGAFSTGELVMERADDTSPSPISLAQDDGANNFDGNPDWAPDGRPLCPDDINVAAVAGNPVLIGMDCEDTGPQYERTSVNEFPTSQPANGTLGPFAIGNPSTVTYTPNPGVTGTDSFQFGSFDAYGFGSDPGTVTITVVAAGGAAGGGGAGGGGGGGAGGGPVPTCGGRPATIVGTAGNNTLFGFGGNDVIVGLGGDDTIRGGGGNDIVCAGTGNDRILGGAGSDRLNGEAGRDRVSGGNGNDTASGGSGNDMLNGDRGQDRLSGGGGNDGLGGGAGRDRLSGGSGNDRLNGGSSRDTCAGGRGRRDRATGCERRSGIP